MNTAPQTVCHRGNIGLPCFGPDPTKVTCPFCRSTVTTKVLPRYEPLTDCDAFCLPFVTCLCCCFCLGGNDDLKHVCPNCNRMLGIYEYTSC